MIAELVPLVAFAYGAGAATFFAPCAYPLLPAYVSYFLGASIVEGRGSDSSRRATLSRAAVVAASASLGFLLVFVAVAAVVATVGPGPLADVAALELVVGAVLVVTGAMTYAGWHPGQSIPLPPRRRSVAGFVGFGVVYAVAAAGCSAPIFVAVGLRGLAAGEAGAVAAFGSFFAGMTTLLVAVTMATALGRDALLARLRDASVERLAGGLLVAAGVVEVYRYLFDYGGLATLGLG